MRYHGYISDLQWSMGSSIYILLGRFYLAILARLEPIMLKIAYYAFEQCSKIKPIMLKIISSKLNYAH